MSTGLSHDVLTGRPEPTRTRWQPLRGGILNLFYYDEQTFAFHRGRLLLRGNNGSGKSLALEVLLPFVLDADLKPTRMSTFGGRDRNIYLWLIGFDKSGARVNERAYVWVEFGRLKDDGSAEYFTAGAMLEGSRDSDVKPAWWTSHSRVGVDLLLGSPGEEPLSRKALAQALADESVAGRQGQIHKDAKSHRTAVNETLYGLSDERFAVLRDTLLQLRRPKLSDKLNEAGLNAILRESLPPIAEATIIDLADGFERLDRHAAAVADMRETIMLLRQLQRAYRTYARIAGAARADAVVSAETAVDAVRDRLNAAESETRAAARALANLEAARLQFEARKAAIRGRTRILSNLEAYRKFDGAEPLRNEVEHLGQVADSFARAARQSRVRAERQNEEARQAAAASQRAQERQDISLAAGSSLAELAFCTALNNRLRRAMRGLADVVIDDLPGLAALVSDADGISEDLRSELDGWQATVQELVVLTDAAERAMNTASGAARETSRAQAEVAAAEESLNRALEADFLAVLGWIDEVDSWTAASVGLRSGQAPPLPWEPVGVLQLAPRWAEEAHDARVVQLRAQIERLQIDSRRGNDAAAAADASASGLAAVANALSAVEVTRNGLQRERESYRTAVGVWSLDLQQLSAGTRVKDWRIIPDDSLPAEVFNWVIGAAEVRGRVLAAQLEAVRLRRVDRVEHLTQLKDREQHLLLNSLPQIEVPLTRADSRVGRAGAPLYLLVEFADHVSPADQLGIEAALIGSGAADAWLHPEGVLRAAGDGQLLLDTQLSATGDAIPQRNTSQLLVPDSRCDERGVTAGTIEAVLTRIGYADAGGPIEMAPLSIGSDGSWRAGPLAGRHHVSAVTLIGATNRENERLNRLRQVQTEIEAAISYLADLDGQRTELEFAFAALETERGSSPSAAGLLAAQLNAAESIAALRREVDRADAFIVAACGLIEVQLGGEMAASMAEDWTHLAGDLGATPLADHVVAVVRHAHSWEAAAEGARTLVDERNRQITVCAELINDVADERRAIPERAVVDSCRQEVQTGRARVHDASVRLAGRQREEIDARQKLSDSTAGQSAAFERMSLPPGTDAHRLQLDVGRYRTAAVAWLRDATRALHAAGQDLLASVAARESAKSAASAEREAASNANLFQEKQSALIELTENYGAEYQMIDDELHALADENDRLAKDETERQTRLLDQNARQARAAAERTAAITDRSEADRVRTAAGEAFVAAWTTGVLGAADFPPPPGFDPSVAVLPPGVRAIRDWARAVREIAGEALARSPADVDQAANRLTESRYEMEPQLAGRVSVRDEHLHGLLILMASRSGNTLPLPEMVSAVGEELIAAERLLAEEEADLFRRFLADTTRREVTGKIRDARTAVKEMADIMAKHPTGSGIRVKLLWTPDEKNAPGMQQIVRLMGRDAPLDSEKERLQQFFRDRIDRVRLRPDLDYVAQMGDLLDYRQWWRFQVEFSRGGSLEWERLNSKSHNTLSGGEKAVCLHLPLFAAAAAYCDSATVRCRDIGGVDAPGAPRLILLDEVFAGVDEDNRGELFDIIRSLDMDLVATSENELGLYPQLDGIAIYQMITHPGVNAILAARSIWDGAAEHQMLDNDMYDPDAPPDLFT